MAPDRGNLARMGSNAKYQTINDDTAARESADEDYSAHPDNNTALRQDEPEQQELREVLAEDADEDRSFTIRGVLVGLVIGVIICFSNMYFGLQTGWVSGMAMPSALIGFAFFKTIAKHIDYPFTPVENVLVQTVAGALGTMPLGCGFVGVLPALNYLLKPEENGPLHLSLGKLMIWAVGICFFGVFIAVPLRKEVIIREKLKFPSGTATALMIGVLHGDKNEGGDAKRENLMENFRRRSHDMLRPSTTTSGLNDSSTQESVGLLPHLRSNAATDEDDVDDKNGWKAKIKLLLIAFGFSAVYTLITYFVPHLHNLPVFGLPLATEWLWTLNPSPAYIGQGIIIGPETTLHMLLGAVIGWGILSPLAKSKGWAPGSVDDWMRGSKGWIVWISLAIMFADSIVSLGWLVLRPTIHHGPRSLKKLYERFKQGNLFSHTSSKGTYAPIADSEHSTSLQPLPPNPSPHPPSPPPEPDAPPSHLVPTPIVYSGFILSIIICIASIHTVFPTTIPLPATLLAILLALLLSLMGVRALGETDLNPVSGISKLTQLLFALVIPSSNPNAIIINLLAGAISESGALQAGDLMQDLKTGHLLHAAPKAQFYGQLIGSFVGAIVSAAVYRLYTAVYRIPGDLFLVPTAYVWVFTARLVTGQGLPPMVAPWALGAGALFALATAARIVGLAQGWRWRPLVPGGIAVAVGMFNVPSFTLARAMGGLVTWYWRGWRRREEAPVIVLASGLILGEGVVSIVNLGLAGLRVPHL